ncbi:hypothetical protein J2X03_000135 [Microbacterium trichothecenolyticum]|nr:hypothetical protein [Microbacterium trichothecenolyticum]MDR7183928.1 hypothetical protein [Microbacterium trichothecenolyticum]
MISETEQTLLLVTAAIITLGTLTVIIWQWWRGRGKRD